MPTLAIHDFNIVCATLGGFITVFGLVSYLLKEKFYLSEALISTFAGVIFSPHALDWLRPLHYANDSEVDLETVTLYFSRLVLCVQLVLAGVSLPSKYLRTEWKSLSILLGPGMCAMWICTSLLVWALVPNISFLFALAIAACVTPTDPVLSNSIVKGKFADKSIPPPLQRIIIAESGANDGLGYPFLFFALYLIKYTDSMAEGIEPGGAAQAMGLWFGDTWAYVILLSVAYGAVVGWLAKELLHWAEERHYVDRESFLVFAIALALFITGTVGLIGSDDVLASFIAGNVFTWDDWFRLETQDDSLQPTIDMLLNVAIFMWFGAVCPWHSFVDNEAIPIYRLIPLGILVLLLRRLPMVLSFHWLGLVHQIEHMKHALFVGFFGPIGVSAIFYLYISREFIRRTQEERPNREDLHHASEAIDVVVWFLVICSIMVHGLVIALAKLGLYLPRTISTAISSERRSQSRSRPQSPEATSRHLADGQNGAPSRELGPPGASSKSIGLVPKGLARAAKRIFDDVRDLSHHGQGHNKNDNEKYEASSDLTNGANGVNGGHPEISMPTDARRIGSVISDAPARNDANEDDARRVEEGQSPVASGTVTPMGGRSMRKVNFAGDASQAQFSSPTSLAKDNVEDYRSAGK